MTDQSPRRETVIRSVFKKRSRALIDLTSACIGLAASALVGAVELNPTGLGQVLLYPYYTVRSSSAGNAINTLFTIGNATDHVKAVRVRFREGAEGVPVAELNVYLAAHDMWTAALVPDADGNVALVSLDHSCVVPPLPTTQPWFTFSGDAYAWETTNTLIGHTREGFFEVVEMGDYGAAADAKPGSVADGVQPIGGYPFDCTRAQADTGAEAQPGTGGLFGRVILINVGDGTEFSSTATALSDFNTTRSLWAPADAPGPTLADADPPVSVIHSPELGTIRTEWTQPIDAVSAVLMRESLSNEFVLDQGTRSITDWVVTMPTKYYYVHDGLAPTRLFQNPFVANGACEIVLPEWTRLIFDRESRTVAPWVGDLPPQGAHSTRALCWVTAVIEFAPVLPVGVPPRMDTLFSSVNHYARTNDNWDPATAAPAMIATTFENGWLRIPLHSTEVAFAPYGNLTTGLQHTLVGGPTTLFKPDGSTESRAQSTYFGLPVIGFAAESYTNGALQINGQQVLANYGGLIPHRYTRHVE